MIRTVILIILLPLGVWAQERFDVGPTDQSPPCANAQIGNTGDLKAGRHTEGEPQNLSILGKMKHQSRFA